MGTFMKTTIEIADDLLIKAKRHARQTHQTLRRVVEDALRLKLMGVSQSQTFRLRKHTFHGAGLQASMTDRRWDTVRDLIYGLD